MRIKYLLTLKQKENKPAWMQIAIYWLAKDIYNYNKNYNHLKHNNITKTNKIAPFYYRELIYYLKIQNPKIPHLKTETKEIYNNILQNGSQNHTIFGEKKWKEKMFTLDFSKIWKNTYFSYCQPQTKDLHYKFLHYAIKTNNYTYQTSRDKIDSPNCNYCKNKENNIHLFITCNGIRKNWTYFQPYFKSLTKRNYTPQQHIFTLTANIDSKTKKLIITIIQIIMYEIWITRNNLKYDKIHITQDTIITQIIIQLQNIILTHYKIHKTNGTLPKFKQNFCINKAIATINNNKLQIMLTQ